ncbi:tyrosine--tRNA ligase, mitochondrial-like [Varroa destructor]|uniref:Tyrosine--tRNA ligase n=1 Tax=Varroa destructor TaxID=109461 RepID=A0A7M7MAB4_VARDE|nr:tyrosine--tRNA ligase, mitochondrial-like [Varroa destructor]
MFLRRYHQYSFHFLRPVEWKQRLTSALIYCNQKSLHSLKERGIIKQVLSSVNESELLRFLHRSNAAYCGFDPTTDSLHVGHLLPIILLLHIQKQGIKPIVVLGDVTAKIGDPSCRVTARDPILEATIRHNCTKIEKNILRIFNNYQTYFQCDSPLPKLQVLRNSSWYRHVNVVHFLATIGRHFRLEKMLERASVQERLANSDGMNVAEFKYQMFQAYDWSELFEQYGCRVQIGGQDQLDNIKGGRNLIKQLYGDEETIGLTTPLISAESGDKYGKTGCSPIWLSSEKNSAYDLYQFFLRMEDIEAERFARMFVFAGNEELQEIVRAHHNYPEKRLCQKKLATDITILVHGQEGLNLAVKATELLFGNKLDLLHQLTTEEFEQIFTKAAYVEIPRCIRDESKIDLVSLSVLAKLFLTEKDAKRIINNGGLYLNMKRVSAIPPDVELPTGITLARVGKKNYTLIKWI